MSDINHNKDKEFLMKGVFTNMENSRMLTIQKGSQQEYRKWFSSNNDTFDIAHKENDKILQSRTS